MSDSRRESHERDQRAATSKLAFARPFPATLACVCMHAYECACMCGRVYDAWVAGGWGEQRVRGAKRPGPIAAMMKREFFRDSER